LANEYVLSLHCAVAPAGALALAAVGALVRATLAGAEVVADAGVLFLGEWLADGVIEADWVLGDVVAAACWSAVFSRDFFVVLAFFVSDFVDDALVALF